MWEGGSSYFFRVTKCDWKHPSVTFPGALGRPPHRSAAHQRTSIHEQTAHKARLLMGEIASMVLKPYGALYTGNLMYFDLFLFSYQSPKYNTLPRDAELPL